MQLTKSITIGKEQVIIKEPNITQIRDLLRAMESGGDLYGLNLITLFGEHWDALKARASVLVIMPHGMSLDDLSESELTQIWEALKELSPFLRQMEAMFLAITQMVAPASN